MFEAEEIESGKVITVYAVKDSEITGELTFLYYNHEIDKWQWKYARYFKPIVK